jgi:hypothetical protein
MTQLQPPLASPAKPKQGSINPFARALAETEQNAYGQPAGATDAASPFSDTLARTGGQFGDLSNSISPDFMKQQQEELLKQKQREALRKKLHDQINPTEQTALFDAREREVKREIDKLRQDLQMLAKDVSKFEKEIERTLLTEVVEPGQTGSYFINFFHKLRSFIMLLRQKIKSASTWAKTAQSKKKKKSKQPGLQIGGLAHEKTSTIQDMMHHERSSTYGGA